MVSNHVSYLDTFILIKAMKSHIINPNYCQIIGMASILNWPIVGYIFKKINMIPIKFTKSNEKTKETYNKDSVKKLYSSVYSHINNKDTILMFPEGKINENPSIMNKIRGGAFNFSKETETPMRIIALKGIDNIWKKNGHPIGSGTIIVKFFDDEYIFDNIEDYRKTVRYVIENYVNN